MATFTTQFKKIFFELPKGNSKVLQDYFYTFFTYGVSILSTLFIYYFISNFYAESEFIKFNLSRRAIAIFNVILMLGLTISLPRSVALTKNNHLYKIRITSKLIAALLLILLITILFSFFILLFPAFWGNLLWDTNVYSSLLIQMAFYLISMGVYTIIFSFARGLMCFKYANLITLWFNLFPLLIVQFLHNIESYYLFTTINNFLIALCFTFLLVRKFELKFFFNFPYILKEGKNLLRYGLPRIPGDFSMEGLLSIPVFITAHLRGNVSASYLAFAVSLVSMMTSFLAPISLILLPESAKRIMNKDMEGLKKYIKTLFYIFIPLVFIATIILQLIAKFIVHIYLNVSSDEAVWDIKIISWVFLPYLIYVILRSVIDIAYFKPKNAINSICALIILIITTGIVYQFQLFKNPSILGFVSAIISLAILSIISFKRIFNQ